MMPTCTYQREQREQREQVVATGGIRQLTGHGLSNDVETRVEEDDTTSPTSSSRFLKGDAYGWHT